MSDANFTNREIKFRGKRIDPENSPGKWEYGSLILEAPPIDIPYFSKLTYPMIWNEKGIYSVDPETVGQYTGLKDKNGIEIYDGDRIFYKNSQESGEGIISFSAGFTIEWDLETCITKTPTILSPLYYFQCSREIEVIGNIFDSPELLDPKVTVTKPKDI